jgi:glycyl-tRNA synthetase beta chain
MAEWLLEILSEEIPARFQKQAAQALEERMQEACTSAGISVSFLHSQVTPRRLVVYGEMAQEVAAYTEERRGPREDAPESVIRGFREALPAHARMERRETPKGSYWFAIFSHPARPTREVLPSLIVGALSLFPWPKTMRWGSSSYTWVRPMRNILCILDGKVLDCPSHGLHATDTTVGHRFLAPERFSVSCFSEYKAALSQRFVLLDRSERAQVLRGQIQALEQHHKVTTIPDASLFEEVLGLVEWPVALLGKIDPCYRALPEELVITLMRVHQRYFATRSPEGTLTPFFVCVAGTQTADHGETIVRGNEAVLKARLSDAHFFFQTDAKTSLAQHAQALSQQTFHHHLGTVSDRIPRLQAWGALLQEALQKEAFFQGILPQDRERALLLCKADLRTEVVKEFPELQGIMGGTYAALQGESPSVAAAIKEHYRPQGPEDSVPETPLGALLALADKLEMLWSFFRIGEHPTGSKDPFSLRRAALGVLRILEVHRGSLDLEALLRQYANLQKKDIPEGLLAFFKERLKGQLKERGVPMSVATALLEAPGLSVVRIMERSAPLTAFLKEPAGKELLQGYRRIASIVKASHEESIALDTSLLTPPEEALYQAFCAAQHAACSLGGESLEDFQKKLAFLVTLRAPINAFFEEVLVNCEEPSVRRNRHALLRSLLAFYEDLCAFSHLEPL